MNSPGSSVNSDYIKTGTWDIRIWDQLCHARKEVFKITISVNNGEVIKQRDKYNNEMKHVFTNEVRLGFKVLSST